MSIISVNQVDGELVVDSRLIADRLDIRHETLMETLEKYQTRIESRFGIIRFETGKIDGRGRPQKFALLNEPQATSLMTFSRNTDAVVECKLDLVNAFEQAKTALISPSTSTAPYYYRRLQLFQERTGRIPAGYFCIFEEITHLVSQLERCGHMIDDDAIIDISVGKLFCKYLRAECEIEPNHYCLSYPHWYPGRNKPVMANLYPVDWLTTFRKWFDFTYCTHHLERYFKGRKDAPAIQAVKKFLGLLPGS